MAGKRNLPSRALSGWSLGLAATLLGGCVQTLPQQVCPPSAQVSQASVRMMVSFRQATAGDAPETLRQLQHHARGCVSYVSSVSPTVHVYAIAGGGDAETLRMNLRSMPAVLDAVPDERVKAQKLR